MRPQFLSDGTDRRSFGGGGLSKPHKGSSLFWWTILITLMMGLATFCWFFSIMVFQHPEKPLNYKVLAKLGKLPVIRKFTVYSVPDGAAKTARELLSGYYGYSPEQLQVANVILKRAYIRNYDKQDPPVYVAGQFQVLECRALTAQDVMSSGWVVRGRAMDLEDVEVEVLMPGPSGSVLPYQPGDQITLDKRATFAALVHLQKLGTERMCATVVPLVYDGFQLADGQGLVMEPPRELNLTAAWPVSKDPGLDESVAAAVPAP